MNTDSWHECRTRDIYHIKCTKLDERRDQCVEECPMSKGTPPKKSVGAVYEYGAIFSLKVSTKFLFHSLSIHTPLCSKEVAAICLLEILQSPLQPTSFPVTTPISHNRPSVRPPKEQGRSQFFFDNLCVITIGNNSYFVKRSSYKTNYTREELVSFFGATMCKTKDNTVFGLHSYPTQSASYLKPRRRMPRYL